MPAVSRADALRPAPSSTGPHYDEVGDPAYARVEDPPYAQVDEPAYAQVKEPTHGQGGRVQDESLHGEYVEPGTLTNPDTQSTEGDYETRASLEPSTPPEGDSTYEAMDAGETAYDDIGPKAPTYDHLAAPKGDYDHLAAPKGDYDHLAPPARDYDHLNATERTYDEVAEFEPTREDVTASQRTHDEATESEHTYANEESQYDDVLGFRATRQAEDRSLPQGGRVEDESLDDVYVEPGSLTSPDAESTEGGYEAMASLEPSIPPESDTTYEEMTAGESAYDAVAADEPPYEEVAPGEPPYEDMAPGEPPYEDMAPTEPPYEEIAPREHTYAAPEPQYETVAGSSVNEPLYNEVDEPVNAQLDAARERVLQPARSLLDDVASLVSEGAAPDVADALEDVYVDMRDCVAEMERVARFQEPDYEDMSIVYENLRTALEPLADAGRIDDSLYRNIVGHAPLFESLYENLDP